MTWQQGEKKLWPFPKSDWETVQSDCLEVLQGAWRVTSYSFNDEGTQGEPWDRLRPRPFYIPLNTDFHVLSIPFSGYSTLGYFEAYCKVSATFIFKHTG
jgi:hypothetical protein